MASRQTSPSTPTACAVDTRVESNTPSDIVACAANSLDADPALPPPQRSLTLDSTSLDVSTLKRCNAFWRDADGNYVGNVDDTVHIALPVAEEPYVSTQKLTKIFDINTTAAGAVMGSSSDAASSGPWQGLPIRKFEDIGLHAGELDLRPWTGFDGVTHVTQPIFPLVHTAVEATRLLDSFQALMIDCGGGGFSAPLVDCTVVVDPATGEVRLVTEVAAKDTCKTKKHVSASAPKNDPEALAAAERKARGQFEGLVDVITVLMSKMLTPHRGRGARFGRGGGRGRPIGERVREFMEINRSEKKGKVSFELALKAVLPSADKQGIRFTAAFTAAMIHATVTDSVLRGDLPEGLPLAIAQTGGPREGVIEADKKAGNSLVQAAYETSVKCYLRQLGHNVFFQVLTNADEAVGETTDFAQQKYIVEHLKAAEHPLPDVGESDIHFSAFFGSTTAQGGYIKITCTDPDVYNVEVLNTGYAPKYGTRVKEYTADQVAEEAARMAAVAAGPVPLVPAEDNMNLAFRDKLESLGLLSKKHYVEPTQKRHGVFFALNSYGYRWREIRAQFKELIAATPRFAKMFEQLSTAKVVDICVIWEFLNTIIDENPIDIENYTLYMMRDAVMCAMRLGMVGYFSDGRGIGAGSTAGGSWLHQFARDCVQCIPVVREALAMVGKPDSDGSINSWGFHTLPVAKPDPLALALLKVEGLQHMVGHISDQVESLLFTLNREYDEYNEYDENAPSRIKAMDRRYQSKLVELKETEELLRIAKEKLKALQRDDVASAAAAATTSTETE